MKTDLNFASFSYFAEQAPGPLGEEAFYGLAGQLVRLVEPSTEADPAAVLVQSLVVFGSLIGRSAHAAVEGDRHGTNLFAVVAGDTAKARKGTSWGRVRGIFQDVAASWTRRCIKSGLSSGEGLIWTIRDPIDEPGKEPDPGVSDKRLLIIESEFASTLKVLRRDGNTLSPIIRAAWDGTDLSSLVKNSPNTATEPHISIIGHITCEEICRGLDETEAANGFGNRFLWVFAKRSKILPEGGDIDPIRTGFLVHQIKQAVEFAIAVDRILFDDVARDVWRQIYPTLSAGKPGLLGALTARAEAQVLRLASIYALLDKSALIRPPHLQAGLSVWRYCEDSCRFIFGARIGYSVADDILAALRRFPTGLTKTDIHNLFHRHRNSKDINKALLALEQLSLAAVQYEESGGRPVERWFATDAKKAKNAN
jgi:hypothetical protein